MKRLEPDPIAAPVVVRIFEEFAAGKGLYAIARGLTEAGIPSPSAHDPDRNRHRVGGHGVWAKSAVRAILKNPRYTGRQVWNRQRREEVLVDVGDVALGHQTKMRWNEPEEWVWSEHAVHEPIIEPDLFNGIRGTSNARQSSSRNRRTRPTSKIVEGPTCPRRAIIRRSDTDLRSSHFA